MNPTFTNYQGDVFPVGGPMQTKRSHRTQVTMSGVDITVHYFETGFCLAATDIDDACAPTCEIKRLEIGSQDVTRLFADLALWDEIAERVEAGWRGVSS